MKKTATFLCIVAFMLCDVRSFSTAQTDSLKAVLARSGEDTSKVNILLALSKKYYSLEPVEGLRYAVAAKELSEKLKFPNGLATALKFIGIANFNLSKYLETLTYWNQSLAVYDSLGDKTGIASMYSNIGSVYYQQASHDKAIEYYLKSLKISEELSDTFRIATAEGNIGNVYGFKKATYDKALAHYLRALPLIEAFKKSNPGGKAPNTNEEINNIIGTIQVGVGEIYFNRTNYDSALYYFEKSLIAYKGTEAIPYSLNDIGLAYAAKGDFNSAIKNHKEAFDIAQKAESKFDMTQSLLGLGNAYEKQGNTVAAIAAFRQAQEIAKELDTKKELKESYEGLARIYTQTADCGNALKYQTLLTGIKDTLYNIETDKKLGSLQFDFDIQKKEGEIHLLEKDQEIKKKEISKQKLVKNGFIGGFAVVLLFAGVFFTQRNRISKEKKRSDELLLNILPEETAEELKATGSAKAKSFDLVSVLFTDFKNFTQASEKLSAEELVQEINYCYSEFDIIVTRYGIEKIKTIGDAYMCAGGLPVTNSTHPEDVVRAGLEMQHFIEKNKKEREANGRPFFELRLGIHTGPVVAGIVGIKKFAYDIWGDTVNTASRMESSGEIGKVNISGTTYELVKDKFKCIHRGKIQAKNKGEIDMYFVERPF